MISYITIIFIMLLLKYLYILSCTYILIKTTESKCDDLNIFDYTKSLQNPCENNKQMNMKSPDNFNMIWNTNYGEFTANCIRNRAPVQVDRIYNLILNGYYNNNYFFRVLDNASLKIIQFGTNGNPNVSNIYNFNSTQLNECAIIKPQPNNMAINIDIHGLSNLFGTISMSTSYNETLETTYNATAELFINTGNNSKLDAMLFVPICLINPVDMEKVVLKFPSFGEVTEIDPDNINGVSLDKLYADGNEYIEANPIWDSMAISSTVRLSCNSNSDTSICGPCNSNKGDRSSYPYQSFTNQEWTCPIDTFDSCNI